MTAVQDEGLNLRAMFGYMGYTECLPCCGFAPTKLAAIERLLQPGRGVQSYACVSLGCTKFA